MRVHQPTLEYSNGRPNEDIGIKSLISSQKSIDMQFDMAKLRNNLQPIIKAQVDASSTGAVGTTKENDKLTAWPNEHGKKT